MKNLFVLLFVVSFVFSCGNKAEMERLQAVNDSLMAIGNDKDGAINDFISGYNEIQENLKKIKEKENIIRNQTSAGGEMQQATKDQINEDILSIYELMLKNKQEVESLQKKLKSSNVKAAEFQKMITTLNEQIARKDQEIEELKQQLEQLNFDIENLNVQIGQLASNVDSLSSENRQKSEELEAKTEALNTAYYVFGTKKELIEKEVITKEGGFIGIGKMEKLRQDFNTDYFSKIDITKVSEIQLSVKKAKMLTTHPAGSFQMIETEKSVDKLVIKDSKKFWSVSKYLVIVTE